METKLKRIAFKRKSFHRGANSKVVLPGFGLLIIVIMPYFIHNYGSLSLYPPYSKKGGHSETLLNTCIAHSNSADLLLSNNASDCLSGDFDKKNQ